MTHTEAEGSRPGDRPQGREHSGVGELPAGAPAPGQDGLSGPGAALLPRRVSPDWVGIRLHWDHLRLVDARVGQGTAGAAVEPRADAEHDDGQVIPALVEYLAAHVPGARLLDQPLARAVDEVDRLVASDWSALDRARRLDLLTRALPRGEQVTAAGRRLGLVDGALVVVYDDGDGRAALPLWWLLRAYGAQDVRVMDGGMSAWRRAYLPIASGQEPEPDDVPFRADLVRARLDELLDGRSAFGQRVAPPA